MPGPKVIKISDLKLENIRFSPVKPNKKLGKSVYINYDYEDGLGPKTLRIQFDKFKTPFGVSAWNDDNPMDRNPTVSSLDSIELAFKEEHLEGVEKIKQIEQMVIEHAAKNSVEFFGGKKKRDVEQCKLFFSTAVKHSEDEEGNVNDKYPPRLKVKLLKNTDNNYAVNVFDNNRQKVSMDINNYADVIPKMSECIVIICPSVWIVDKFGISWRPEQMKVFKSESKLSSYAFIDDGENGSGEGNESPSDEDTPEAVPDVETEGSGDVDEDPEPASEPEEPVQDDPLEEEVKPVVKQSRRRK